MSRELVGKPAPDFTLADQHGSPVTLSALRGAPVLVVFIPYAFSPVCTTEVLELRDAGALESADDVRIITVSCDSIFAIRAFAEQTGFRHTIVSDFWPHGAVSREYGVFDEEKGRADRASFLVDSDGVIRWSVINPDGEAREVAAYEAAIAALR